MLLGGCGFHERYALVVEGVRLVDQRVEAADEGGGHLSGLHHALGEGVGGHLVVFLVHAEADFLGALHRESSARGVGALLGRGVAYCWFFSFSAATTSVRVIAASASGMPCLGEVGQQALDGGRLLQVGEARGADVGFHGEGIASRRPCVAPPAGFSSFAVTVEVMKVEQVVPLLVEGGHLRGFLAGRGLVDGVGQQVEVGGEGRAQLWRGCPAGRSGRS